MNSDNTLKTMTVLITVVFLIMAMKTAYAGTVGSSCNPGSALFWLDAAWIFTLYEAPFLLAVYVAGPMVNDAMPAMFAIGRKCAAVVKLSRSKTVDSVNGTESLEADEISITSDRQGEECEVSVVENDKTAELSEEIIGYVSGTFGNLLSDEQIEKLLGNFRKLNTCGPFEVVEKQRLKDVFEFDLIHFAWNVCKRIHRPDTCPKIFGFATAELIKASFPLTLGKYAVGTIKSRLKDSDPTTKFRLKIIDTDQQLVPHVFSEMGDTK